MTVHHAAYLEAAESALRLVQHPAVADRWERPSALAEMTVGDLACHLAGQVFSAHEVVAAGLSGDEPIALLEHYRRAAWVGADLDDEVNLSIRQGAARMSQRGHAALVARLDEELTEVRELLASGPPTVVRIPWQGWSLRLEDFLVTRMMEIAVHSDDLAASVDIDAAELQDGVLAPVLGLLTTLSVRRHGQSAVLSALTRAERAPRTISAF